MQRSCATHTTVSCDRPHIKDKYLPFHRLMNQFLKTVDYQLLIKPTNLRMVVQHLDASQTIATKLNLETFTKLCGALHACQEWGSLLTLFHRSLRLIPSTQDLVCEPFEALVRQLGVSEKLMSVFERLTEEQKGGLSNQVCAGRGEPDIVGVWL